MATGPIPTDRSALVESQVGAEARRIRPDNITAGDIAIERCRPSRKSRLVRKPVIPAGQFIAAGPIPTDRSALVESQCGAEARRIRPDNQAWDFAPVNGVPGLFPASGVLSRGCR